MSGYIKSKYSNFRIIINYYIVLLLLTIYSIHKNGIILYQKNLISFISIFKPFIVVILSLLISYLFIYIYSKYIKKKQVNLLTEYKPLYIALIMLTLPSNLNIFIYLLFIIIISILSLLIKNDYINYYALYKLLFVILLILFNKYSYLNLYNQNIEVNYSLIDLFIGKGIGGLATSSILLVMICYVILSLNPYKKEIPIISLFSYICVMLMYSLLIKSDIILCVEDLITSEFMYGIVFIATISHYSPISPKYRTIYATLIGILSFIFNTIINIYEGVFIAIILSNLLINLYTYLERKIKSEHQ